MKLVFESDLRGFNESATKVSVFAFDDELEAFCFWNASHQEQCDIMDVLDDTIYPYSVAPGARYHAYNFEVYDGFLVQFDTVAWNV